MIKRFLCCLALLAVAPCAQAVSIVQTATFSGSASTSGGSSTLSSANWLFASAGPGLTSVVFEATIVTAGHLTDSNPFLFDITRQGSLSAKSTFAFFAPTTGTIPAPDIWPPGTSGPTVVLHPGEFYTFDAEFIHTALVSFSGADLALFSSPNPRLLYGNSVQGRADFGSIYTNWAGDFSLRYEYAGSPVGVPDGGTTALLFALACAGLCFMGGRFHQEPGIA